MKKQLLLIISLVALLALTLCLGLVSYADAPALEGAGSEESPYLISTKEDLQAFSFYVNGGSGWSNSGSGGADCEGLYFVLNEDIDMTSADWTPLGYWNAKFKGTFNGQNHTITGLVSDHSSGYTMGGFICTGVNATVKNVTFNGITVTGNNTVGGVIGKSENCIFENVTVNNVSAVASGDYVGGFVGNGSATVKNVTINGVTASTTTWYMGGFAGKLSGSIKNLNVKGAVSLTGNDSHYGGVIGYASNLEISDLKMSEGSVTITATSGDNHGGVVGKFENSTLSSAEIKSSIVITNGFSACGGIVGGSFGGTLSKITMSASQDIKASYNNSPIVGKTYSGTLDIVDVAVIGKCTVGGNNIGRVIGESASGSVTNISTAYSTYRTDPVASVSGTVYYGVALDEEGNYTNGVFYNTDGITPAAGYVLSKNLEKNVWYVTATAFDGGDGSESNPYLIANAKQLRYFRDYVNASTNSGSDGNDCEGLYFKLTDDINLKGESWLPVGYWNMSFKGTFDGDGYTIKGAVVDHFSGWGIGFFGTLDGATIKNVNFENIAAITNTGTYGTGIIAGKAKNGTEFINVNFVGNGNVVNGGNNTGYMIGSAEDTTVKFYCCTYETMPSVIVGDSVVSEPWMIGNKATYENIFTHKYATEIITAATCTDDGTGRYVCEYCGDSYTYTIPQNPDEHTLVNVAAKPATCTAVGWNEYATCSLCGYTTYSEIPIDATAHNFDATTGECLNGCGLNVIIGTTVYWQLEDGELTISGNGIIPDFTAKTDRPWNGQTITSVTVEEGITSIGKLSFSGFGSLTSVVIPNGVTTLGFDCMSGNTIAYLELPDTITTVNQGSVYGSSITTISCSLDYRAFKAKVTSFGAYNDAYKNATWTDTEVYGTRIKFSIYGSGMENYNNQTVVLICPKYSMDDYTDSWAFLNDLTREWTLVFDDGVTKNTVTLKGSSVYNGGTWGILRFQPCTVKDPNRFTPVSGTQYTLTAKTTVNGIEYSYTCPDKYSIAAEPIVPALYTITWNLNGE